MPLSKIQKYITKKALLCFGFFACGVVAGVFIGRYLIKKEPGVYKIHPANQQFKFINPLIGFELAEGQDNFGELQPLRRKFEKTIESQPKNIRVSIYYRNMENGHWIGFNESESYNPASLYKVPFMIAFLRAVQDNPNLLSKRITFTAEDAGRERVKPTAQVADLEVGQSYGTDELLTRMVVDSSNAAKDLLINNIDFNYVRDVFGEFGIPVLGEEYYQISAKTYSLFFRTLYNATLLNRDMSERALELLNRAEFKYGLKSGLPADIALTHKFGDHAVFENGKITGYELHDCGIIYFPSRPSFLCVMTKGPDLQTLSRVIQEIARSAYEERGKTK